MDPGRPHQPLDPPPSPSKSKKRKKEKEKTTTATKNSTTETHLYQRNHYLLLYLMKIDVDALTGNALASVPACQ